MAVPLGLASGIYLAEYAKGRWKNILSFAVDLLAGTPSIIMGLFGFALILFLAENDSAGRERLLAPRRLLPSFTCITVHDTHHSGGP